MATSAPLLYEVIGAVYDALGFGVVGDEVFRDLVIARIVAPTSEADSIRFWLNLVCKRCRTGPFNADWRASGQRDTAT